MKYEKPSVAILNDAAKAIQSGQGQKSIFAQDTQLVNQPSTGAYEADE